MRIITRMLRVRYSLRTLLAAALLAGSNDLDRAYKSMVDPRLSGKFGSKLAKDLAMWPNHPEAILADK